MIRRFLVGLASLSCFATVAHAGYTVDPVDLRAAHNHSTCTSAGVWGGVTGYPRCLATADGTFRYTFGTLVAGSAPTIAPTRIRVVPRTVAVSGANDQIRVTYKCLATPQGSPEALTFPTGTSITYDLGTLACVVDEPCNLDDATTHGIRDNDTGSACAGTTCNNSVLICEIGIDAGIANEYTGSIDFLQEKHDVAP